MPTLIRKSPRAGKPSRSTITPRDRRDLAAAMRDELRLRRERGEVVPAADVRRKMFAAAREVRDALLNIPDRVSAQLAGEPDPVKCHGILEGEIRKALADLVARLERGS